MVYWKIQWKIDQIWGDKNFFCKFLLFWKIKRVIISSATLNIDKFSKYFNCKVITVEGRVFHVDLYHSKLQQVFIFIIIILRIILLNKKVMTINGPMDDSYVKSAAEFAMKIHLNEVNFFFFKFKI